MKKIFTLISLALVAMSVNAQENRKFTYCVPADFDLSQASQKVEARDESNELMGTIEILSSPNQNELYEELRESGEQVIDGEGYPQYDTTKPKDPWSFRVNGDASGNMSLSALVSGFDKCILGKGNPVLSQVEEWRWDDDKSRYSWYVGDYAYWEPGCGQLPTRGEYIKVTPTADGAITIGMFLNKGGGTSGHGHQLYVVDESTKDEGYKALKGDQLIIKGYFNNNTSAPDERLRQQNPDTGEWEDVKDPETGEDVKNYPYGTELPLTIPLSENYSVFEYVSYDGNVKRLDKVFFGTVSFNVKKDVTYWLFNPSSQFGFYGFKLEVGGTIDAGVSAVKADVADANAPIYNLAGQKVGKDFKGLVIQNGKKFVVK